MSKLNPPSADSVVEVDESLVERYVAAGWTLVEEPKAKKATPKPASK